MPGQKVFKSSKLLTFQVELGDAEYAELMHRPRTYVEGRVTVGDATFEQVGVRLKGSGTFQPISANPDLTLKFNWKNSTQDFAGLPKLFLNNSLQDATKLCELLGSGAFRDAGLPVPRITHARLRLNGRDLGVHVLAEPVNKRFLKKHFHDSSGNLYEGVFRDIGDRLEQDNGEVRDRSDLRQLSATAAQARQSGDVAALSHLLDMDKFLTFLAVELIIANWDGYAYHQNNYRVYHDPVSDRMSIVPHGLDNTFFESGLTLLPPSRSLLVSALIRTPAEHENFRRRVAALLPKILDREKIRARIQAAVARMEQGATPEEAAGIERKAALLQQRISERADHLCKELAGTKPLTPSFDTMGYASLEGWSPKPDWNHSPLRLTWAAGHPLFEIQATNDFCFGSWRLPLWLAPGRYRFEGVVKTEGIIGLNSGTGSGAGVRIAGGSRGSGIQGTQDWSPVQYEFVVTEGREWVELIAELRAFSGTASFDPVKFRLVRLPD